MKWDKNTLGTTIDAEVGKAVAYSERLSSDKQDNNIISLTRKIMPKTIKTPIGLKATERGMEETKDMPYIRRAFEMKAEGRQGKDISEYLLKQGIKIKEGNLMAMLWSKTQYIGQYTHPKTGEVFENLKFTKGEPAISLTLWDNVQRRIGKKVGRHRDAYQNDTIASRLRWEDDLEGIYSFSPYIQKKKYKNFKSNAFGGFDRSEIKIIEDFIKYLRSRFDSLYENNLDYVNNRGRDIYMGIGQRYLDVLRQRYHLFQTSNSYSEKRIYEIGQAQFYLWNTGRYLREGFYCFPFDGEWKDVEHSYSDIGALRSQQESIQRCFDTLLDKEIQLWKESNGRQKGIIETLNENRKKGLREESYNIFISLIKENIPIEAKEKEMQRKNELDKVVKQKEAIADSIITKRTKLTMAFVQSDSMTKEDYENTLLMIEDEAKKLLVSLEKQIEELSSSSDLEKFIFRLPEVMGKVFELASKVLQREDIENSEEDLYKLIELTVFELLVNNKKELIIKLFEGLNDLGNLNGGR